MFSTHKLTVVSSNEFDERLNASRSGSYESESLDLFRSIGVDCPQKHTRTRLSSIVIATAPINSDCDRIKPDQFLTGTQTA